MSTRNTSSQRSGLIAAALFLLLTACGGGGGGRPAPAAVEVACPVLPQMSGEIDVDALSVFPGGPEIDVGNVGVGASHHTWGFVTFDLSAVPAGAKIRSARLEIYQSDSYYGQAALPVVLDHVEASGQAPTFVELALGGFDLEVPMRGPGGQLLVLTNSTANDWRIVDVSRQVEADLAAGRSLTRFRLRSDTRQPQRGSVEFDLRDNGQQGWAPKLVVTYE